MTEADALSMLLRIHGRIWRQHSVPIAERVTACGIINGAMVRVIRAYGLLPRSIARQEGEMA